MNALVHAALNLVGAAAVVALVWLAFRQCPLCGHNPGAHHTGCPCAVSDGREGS